MCTNPTFFGWDKEQIACEYLLMNFVEHSVAHETAKNYLTKTSYISIFCD
jgi:hypothetical protein